LQTSALPLGYAAICEHKGKRRARKGKRQKEKGKLRNLPFPFTFLLLPSLLRLERETRFELATLALARRCSTTELLPLFKDIDSNYWGLLVKAAPRRSRVLI
jgi:hypothetical protein